MMVATQQQQRPAHAPTVTPVRIVTWFIEGDRCMTAVHAPKGPGDKEPWHVYEGDRFIGCYPTGKIPQGAITHFNGVGPVTVIEDGRYYEISVDGCPGTGVRNSPLTALVPDRPWMVSYRSRSGGRTVMDAMPDNAIAIVRPLPRT